MSIQSLFSAMTVALTETDHIIFQAQSASVKTTKFNMMNGEYKIDS